MENNIQGDTSIDSLKLITENYRSLGQKKKQQPVNISQLDKIIHEIRLRLKLNKIKFNEIDLYITTTPSDT